MSSIFGPESDSDDDVDSRQINYANYNVGDFISFKKLSNEPISYGLISEILADTSEGKPYNIIYYDDTRSNPIITTELRENVSAFSPDPIIQLRHYDGIFRMLYDVTKIPDIQVPEPILNALQGAFNTREGTFVTPPDSPFATPPVSRSTTGTPYDNISRDSSNSSSSISSSISRSSSSSGGKRYRNKKNKTKRRNKKTKRRRNRKSKRR
jgi:hypothetical protein